MRALARRAACAVLVAAIPALSGCGPSLDEQARRLGHQPFSRQAWAVADQVKRGAMTASLIAQHPPVTQTAQGLRDLLGPPTGYFDYDENLAYVVGPTSIASKYAQGYLLVFMVDKASGKITSARFEPPVN